MTATHLSALTFQSAQPKRLADFYRDVIGIPLSVNAHGTVGEHPEGIFGGIHFAILKAAPNLGGPIVPVFYVANLDASIGAVHEAGADAVFGRVDIGEGKSVAAFIDPDGNVFRLIEIADKGQIAQDP